MWLWSGCFKLSLVARARLAQGVAANRIELVAWLALFPASVAEQDGGRKLFNVNVGAVSSSEQCDLMWMTCGSHMELANRWIDELLSALVASALKLWKEGGEKAQVWPKTETPVLSCSIWLSLGHLPMVISRLGHADRAFPDGSFTNAAPHAVLEILLQ